MPPPIPLTAVLRTLANACDLAMARPLGHSLLVARAALRLGRALQLSQPLLADLLIASLCHAAGAVAVAGDLGRVLSRDERDCLRRHPTDLVFALLEQAPDHAEEGDIQDRTGIFLRHYAILERFPAWTSAWLRRAGLARAGDIALGLFDGLHRAGHEPEVRAASAALGAAYHLTSLRWLGSGKDPLEPRAAALRADAAWIDALVGARLPAQVAQHARALWLDDDAWRDLDLADPAPADLHGLDPVLFACLSSPPGAASPLVEADILALLAPHMGAALALDDPSLEGWLSLLGVMIDYKTCFEDGHSARVANLSAELALLLGADDEALRAVRLAAAVYGAGRLALPSALLEAAAPLDEAGQALLRQAPAALQALLAPLTLTNPLVEVALAQTERLDGSGRPHGLRGAQIPLGARILAVVDTFEALIAERPYRPAYARARALHILQAQSGRLFDGVVTDTLEGVARGEL